MIFGKILKIWQVTAISVQPAETDLIVNSFLETELSSNIILLISGQHLSKHCTSMRITTYAMYHVYCGDAGLLNWSALTLRIMYLPFDTYKQTCPETIPLSCIKQALRIQLSRYVGVYKV